MEIIRINEAIADTLASFKAEAGDEAECEVVETATGYALHTRTWSGLRDVGMVDVYEDDADAVADLLNIDGEAFAWCMGTDGNITLARFDGVQERDTWLKQK